MIFSPNVERWRSHILRYVPVPAGGIDYWLAWMTKESGGNPCSYTSLRESGLFQLMPPDNTDRGGTSEAALRAACSGSSLTRSMSEREIAEQMLSFQRYLSYITDKAREKLAATGVPWVDGPSFWSFVKLQHAYPSPSQGWLAAATSRLGRAPVDWKEFRAALPVTSTLMERVLRNAEEVGFYGSVQIPILTAAIVGGAAVLYYLYRRKRR